jgi:CDP-glucose 4,6-dehydratase|tara:strand:+ start:448 stop:1515 length:1068 start_codon:yes stop_codon:yes gene_type:complete
MSYSIDKKFWNKKKVFVTGHTGFKGSWLCVFLHFLGAEVTGYSLKPRTKPSLYNLAKINKIIKKSVIADVRDYKKLYKEIKNSNATIIFHLAAQPLVRYSYLLPKETFDTNVLGSLNVLECVRRIKKVKSSIIITTDKVYDNSKNKIFKETDKLGGIDPYSSSKVCVEHLFSSYINSFFKKSKNQKLATVRAGNVIGGGDYSEDRLISDIYRFAKKNKKIILRNPNSTRPWQHVLEPLSGYLLLAEKLNKNKLNKIDQNWNFGPNISNCKSVKYIANYFAKSLKLEIKIAKNNSKDFKPETSYLRLSNYKARKVLKWHPRWSLNKSLNKILEWNNNAKSKGYKKVCEDQIKNYLS